MDGWTLGFVANAIIAIAYLAVAALIAVNAIRSRQWRTNTLGLATVFIFFSCGGGHAVHAFSLLAATLGSHAAYAEGARVMYSEPHMWIWDFVTAGVGIWYWTQRRRFPELVTGTAVYEDLRVRQRRALEINDNVVQGLARAKLSLELHQDVEGAIALETTRVAGHRIVDDLERPAAGGGTP